MFRTQTKELSFVFKNKWEELKIAFEQPEKSQDKT